MTQTKKSLYFICFLQFIGPIFVILGHAKNGLPYNEFLQGMRTFIYVFHMPLFFFISAYLFAYKGGLTGKNYKDFVKKKFWRLLFPYIVLNLICMIPKVLLAGFIQDNMEISWDNFMNLWINPRANILGHLWFLFALFELYLLAPVWNYFIKKDSKILWAILFIGAVVLRFLTPSTEVLAINDLMRNLMFFVLGMWFGKIAVDKLEANTTRKNFMIYLAIYVTLLVIWICAQNNLTTTLLCTITLIVLLKLPIVLKIDNPVINRLAKYSYTIYILHWPTMLVVRILGYQILHINYIVIAIAMVLAGYFIPLAIAKVYHFIKKKFNRDFKIIYYLLGM